MRFTETIRSSFASLWSMKIRSILTSLGVIIGVFAIAALLSVGEASARDINDNLATLNANSLSVRFYDENAVVDLKELLELQNENDSIDAIAPILQTNTKVSNGNTYLEVETIATTWEYAKVENFKLSAGRFILPADHDEENKTIVLGSTIALKLFGNTDIIGNKVYLNGIEFTIAGVGSNMPETWLGNPNERVIIPMSAGQKYLDLGEMNYFKALAASEERIDSAVTVLSSFIRNKVETNDDYDVYTATELLTTISETNDTMMTMLGGIGGISLLVSGIGIMNIMLVSVRERTREIGIRKAVGAKRKDILTQFLIEAIVLSGIGGLMGIGLTYLLANPIGAFMGSEIIPSMNIIITSLGFSVTIGVVFGLYPAAKASKLNPIQALRYE